MCAMPERVSKADGLSIAKNKNAVQGVFLAVGAWEFPTGNLDCWQEIFIKSMMPLIKWYQT